jgi:ArsR family transcriptional regulator, arsenate/arsenite/antimonite-responsive transcriptional repressor
MRRLGTVVDLGDAPAQPLSPQAQADPPVERAEGV